MPFPDQRFIESPSLQNVFRDKDSGEPLSAGIVTFYSDTQRSTLKNIYQQIRQQDGTYTYATLPNPLTLSSIGTYVDNSGNDINVYCYPFTGAPTDAVQ